AIGVADRTLDRGLAERGALEAIEEFLDFRSVEPNGHSNVAPGERPPEKCAELSEPRSVATCRESARGRAVDVEREPDVRRRHVERAIADADLAGKSHDPRRQT